LKSAKGRDSVRTATKQLTDITSVYRRVINLTNSDQTVRLNKATAADRAGSIIQKAGLDLFQVGSFEDDEFSIRYLLATTWTKALGVNPATGGVSLYSQLLFGNILSPLQFTSTVNDYAPNGIDQANVLRLSSNATRTLTGIAGGVDGRVLLLMNVGNFDIDLENEGGTSTSSNRFKLTGNLSIAPNSSVLVMYDGASSRWRQVAGTGAGGGSDSEGDKGWSPVLAYVADGNRIVSKIADWVGGEGSKPATGAFIGATGAVEKAADAVSVLGPKGDQIRLRIDLPSRQVQWSYVGSLDWIDLIPFDDITGPPSTLEWNFSASIVDGDPGTGALRFNSNNVGTITHLFFSKQYRQGSDASAFLNTFDDSSSLPNRGTLLMLDTTDHNKVATFQVIGDLIDAGAYVKVPVTPIGGAIFGNTRRVSVLFIRTGDKGIPGIIPRGNYDPERGYLVGDVVDQDGSSYISLIQPNLGKAITPEGTNASWALFARGVNQAFITAINLTLAQSTERAAAALASQILSADYAQRTDGYVPLTTDNSSKSWAIGGTLQGQPSAGDARSWAIRVTSKVDGTEFSAKEYAQGSQAATGGSAKNWASQIGADVTGAAANSRSAKSWAQEHIIGATLGGSARDWAVEVNATVDGTLYSSREYAQGTQTGTGGSSKNWAQQTGSDVTGASANARSAKSWAQENIVGATLGGSAKDWASYIGGTVDGVFYSARQYAIDAKNSRDNVANMEENTEAAATAALSAQISAAASATVAGQKADLAATKADLASTKADTATAQATLATAAKDAAVLAKTDAQSAATGAGSDKAATLAARDEAQGYAAAAAGYANILANPDYGFFTDTPVDNRDYGSF
jgi:hypothetical protein